MVDLSKIRSIDLVSFCTEKLGLRVVHDIGGRVYFYSPFRSETMPSFTVSRRTNRYKDWGIDNTDKSSGGDIIVLRLAVKLHGVFAFRWKILDCAPVLLVSPASMRGQ